MTIRSIRISQPTELEIKNGRLWMGQVERQISIPLDEVTSITLEHPGIVVSTNVMLAAAKQGISIVICDQETLPIGMYTPYYFPSKGLQALQSQLRLTKPFNKRCWQAIVQSKLRNQSLCCSLIGRDDIAKELRLSANHVTSGDATNREEYGNKLYYSEVIFERLGVEEVLDCKKESLRYGYTLIRTAIARALAEQGLIPSIGVRSIGELVHYGLVDDLSEPFYPLVDLFVIYWTETHAISKGEVSSLKHELTQLLNYSIRMEGQIVTVNDSVDALICNYVEACKHADAKLLLMPELVPLRLL